MTLAAALLLAWPATVRAQAGAGRDVILPPQVLDHDDAVYPPAALKEGLHGTVVLFVTVGIDGSVEEVAIAQSAGKLLDHAAIKAVTRWKFNPARRGETPVRARIRVPFHFTPPIEEHDHDDEHTPPPGAPEGAAPAESIEAPGVTGGVTASHHDIEAHSGPHRHKDEHRHQRVTVLGRARSPQRGASDFEFSIGTLRVVPRRTAQEFLNLAPGIMLTNRHGEGHAEQVFLRGFDAREGQDLEFTLGGVPINDVGNPHGQGYADTHFIIPELVDTLRVLEGPFDPHQGNFAVAGSADYELGLRERGLTVKYTTGSFGTQRGLVLWGPHDESHRTFGAAEAYKTDGFGMNRYAQRGSAMAQYEGKFGERGSWRLTGTAYATHFNSAGVLRADDVSAGKAGFFDTYDPTQGGDASRFSLASDIESRTGRTTLSQQFFWIERSMRLRENFTGFLLDEQKVYQSLHPQRGDLIDSNMDAHVFGGRGSARSHWSVGGFEQHLELGYLARLDQVDSAQKRNRFGTTVPYLTNSDLSSTVGNIGLYADTNLRLLSWITLRGGLRGDFFANNVFNRCAVTDGVRGATVDAECQSVDRTGYRSPDQRASTSSFLLQPRASLIVGPFQGFTFNGSYGQGARSIDPVYVTQDDKTPFARIAAYEGGVQYARDLESLHASARSVFYQTHVDRDLIFSETAGRNTLSSGTTRTGWLGAVRLTGPFFEQAANLTLVKAKFDDTGLLVPYAPDLVLRSDTALFADLPWTLVRRPIKASLGAGVSYVGKRPLPYGERSQAIFTIDAAASLQWWNYHLSLQSTNLLDNRYRVAEYNYVSNFGNSAWPPLVASRHFTAGPPRAVFLSLSITLDDFGS
jgi:TonB family protein